MAPIIISIEGNIGAGKTTLLNYLKLNLPSIKHVPVVFLDEPVEEWATIVNEEGKTMLELFYSNPKRYSFSFQMMAYISRLTQLSEIVKQHPNDIIITERSLMTDYHVFAKMLYESKDIPQEEYLIYCKWFHYFNHFDIKGIVYLPCTPEVAMERCIKRNREGETMDLTYLQTLDDKHETWLSLEEHADVLTLNPDQDLEDMMYSIEDFIIDLLEEGDTLGNGLQWVVNHFNQYQHICIIWGIALLCYLQKA